MSEARELICRPPRGRALQYLGALGVAGTVAAVVRGLSGTLDLWVCGGLLSAVVGAVSLHTAALRLVADEYGVHTRTLLRRRSVPWRDIADLQVCLRYASSSYGPQFRIGLVPREGRARLLPLPRGWAPDHSDFDERVGVLRALHRRHGSPDSDHVPVVSARAAGRGRAGSLGLCALLLAGAGVAAWFVPAAEAGEQAWKAAAPCRVTAPQERRDDCLTHEPAVVSRTVAARTKRQSWLYLADGRPLERVAVSREAAQRFVPGDRVELTFWHGEVREVVGERHVWREHVPAAGELAVIAAVLALGAGYPGARVLLGVRGRRLPRDEVLPSALPFAVALAGTGLWLLPLCRLHPTTLLTSPAAVTWAAAGSAGTLALFAWAWRRTRVLPPGEVAADGGTADGGTDVFLAARFLEYTDYNPYGFGTHVVLGDGPPSVVPHPGPGRFAARRIPAERFALTGLRRVRGGDGDTVSGSWHVAEFDDGGRPVRLAAEPGDLARIVGALGTAGASTGGAQAADTSEAQAAGASGARLPESPAPRAAHGPTG
ncbi:PH domain-containing protein [Streptomyces fructofermentans]|uniref:Membrane protein n=1 Tax=Streptomyces fructofermentans TaxID=152141 RepID=A0A918KG72_9ACTN|nr:PH domain-containing protein [Streptomyces fructofermentans]GGX62578.1 membrane protein [Streptomyces fructofermentans]